jgi:Na+-driven multidrug efflux pump
MVRLAIPVVAVQLGWMSMGVVDTIFGMGVLMGLDPIVAQAVGAGEEIAVARAVQRGATLIPLAGVLRDPGRVDRHPARHGGHPHAPHREHLGYWVVALPLAAYLGLHTAAGPAGMWWGLVVGLVVVAAVLVVRVRRRLLGRLQRVTVDSPAAEW